MLREPQRDEALYHLRRGLLLERAARVEEAVEEYRLALSHNPHLAEAHRALASYYHRQGMLAKAADSLRVAANLDDGFADRLLLGCLLVDLGRYEEALGELRRCLRREPGHAAAHYESAIAHFQQGEYLAAHTHLLAALPTFHGDWQIHYLTGSCQLRLAAYDPARDAFASALALAPDDEARAQVRSRLATVERYRELGAPRGLKDRLYAEFGVAVLGSAQDDGLELDECPDYYFTYPDIATTLRRLLATIAGCHWQIDCVVAAERLASPLATALGTALGAPVRRPEEVAAGERALVMLAVGHAPELLQLTAGRVAGRPITFCLGINWLRHTTTLPDLMGVVVRGACGVPWEAELRRLRASGAAPHQVELCLGRATAALAAALAEVAPEPGVAAQVSYYRERRTLRFAEL